MIKKFSEFSKDEFKKIADIISDKLNFKLIRCLGHGDFGYAFLTNNDRVLKITTDSREYNSAKDLKNIDSKYIVKTYDLGEIEGIFYIVYEYIKNIKNEEKELFAKLFIEFYYFHELITKKTWTPDFEEELVEFTNRCDNPKLVYKVAKKLRELYRNVLPFNVRFDDIHVDNVGVKDDHYVLFDVVLDKYCNMKSFKETWQPNI